MARTMTILESPTAVGTAAAPTARGGPRQKAEPVQYTWQDLEFLQHDGQLFKKQEAADLLRVSIRTLERMVERREVPYLHFGRAIRFPVEGLRRYIRGKVQWGEVIPITPDTYVRPRNRPEGG